MAKVVVTGDAVVITSAMKLEDLKLIQKYRPDALVLKGGEDGKEPVFAVGVTDGRGDISKFGISFDSESRNEEKKAVLTMVAPKGIENIKEFLADNYGTAIENLKKLESTLPAVVQAIAESRKAIIDGITVQ